MVLTLGLLTLVVSAQHQSPINIVTGATSQNSSLNPLSFNNRYRVQVSGDFEYTGTILRFVPDSGPPATLTNHLGTYKLREIVFHWGNTSSQGSEHQLDRTKYAAEIHFVHLKQGASSSDTAGDTFAMVAVLCHNVSGMATGVWSDLSPVPTTGSSNPVFNINIKYADLLPDNRDYYQYYGSHTTSPFTENAVWQVMQNTIPIPEGFLTSLRQVQLSNFRGLQNLNGRSVFKFPFP